jgi:hypothetical protein
MLGVQLHINDKLPSNNFIEPVKNVWVKPAGGLWTSTFNGGASAWVDWCVGNEFGDPYSKKWFLLSPHEDTRILTINSYNKLHKILKEYPFKRQHPLGGYDEYLDYEAISKDYDAIHLTEKGQIETHLSGCINLHGWDCESVLWFRWGFKEACEFLEGNNNDTRRSL